MAGFLTGIASMEATLKRKCQRSYINTIIDTNYSLKAQQIFEENTQRAISLQRTLDDYVERYKKLIPLLELVSQDLNLKIPPKQDPQIKPPTAPTSTSNTPNAGPGSNNGPGPKKAPQRKRTYTKKNQAPAQTPTTHSNAPILPNTNNGGSYQAGSMIGFQPFQGNNNGTTDANGSENQPILL